MNKKEKIFKILLIKPISFVKITKSELEEIFTEELYENISLNDILQNKVAVVGEDTFYIRGDDDRINQLYNFFSKYHEIEISDVSEKFLIDNELYNSINKKDLKEFKLFFNNYRLEYTTKDNVLDKILKFGIGYIDSIDKKILKSNND